MSVVQFNSNEASRQQGSVLRSAVGARLAGPGGSYNIGNVLGLVVGIALQIAMAPANGTDRTAATVLLDFLAGSSSATALTVATLVFCCSGEIYHRAWMRSPAPDPTLNRLGDFLSGIGALLFGLSLFLLGQPVLAATAGLLGAFGKFGSACQPDMRAIGWWPAAWPDPFRSAVVVSRIPALAAAALGLANAGGEFAPTVQAATLIVCILLWVRADLLLFASHRSTAKPAAASNSAGA